jgi:hypothetical protein
VITQKIRIARVEFNLINFGVWFEGQGRIARVQINFGVWFAGADVWWHCPRRVGTPSPTARPPALPTKLYQNDN